MAKNENRKKFLKNAGILGLAGIFGLSKMGNMPVVKAAVSDNAVAEDISKDIIRCSSSGVFTSGETAEDLADAVNGLNDSFSSALTDLKATDVATFVGAQGNTFTTVIEKLKSILQTKETTATTSAQTITPDSGKVLKSVKVNPQKHSGTLDKSSAFVSEIDLGELHNYRKVKTKVPSGTKEITSNGTTNIAGYESVKVNVSTTGEIAIGSVASNKNGISNSNGYSYWGTIISSYSLLKSDYFTNSGGVLTCKKACKVCIVIDADYYMGRAWAKAYCYINSNGQANNNAFIAQGAENASPQTEALILNLNIGDKLFFTIESQNNNTVNGWVRIFICS